MNKLPKSNNSHNHNNLNKNSDPESKVHHLHEVQPSDWHQRMANLVGLEEEISKNPSYRESSALETTETTSRRDDEAPAPPSPSSLKTKQPLSSNPFAKVGVVGAATLGVVLVAGAFLSQLMSGTNKQPRKDFPQVTRKTEPDKIEQLKPEQEIEILKTKLALAEQAKAVKLAQLQLKTVRPNQTPAQPTPAQPRTQPQPVTRVVVQRVPTPERTVYVPRVVERIVRVPQPVAQAKPTPTQPTQIPQPTAKPSVSPSFDLSTPELTPQDFAQIPFSLSIAPTPTPTPTPNLPRVASSPADSDSEPSEQEILPVPRTRNTATNPQRTPSALNQTIQHSSTSVAVGTSAKAVLVTAISGEASKAGINNNSGNNSNNNKKNDNQFVVRLKEPLKSIDGKIALPANTELLAQIQQINESGSVELSVVSVVSQNKSKLTEIRLPQSALKVRARGGRPLLARKYPEKSGKIAGMDTLIFGLGGIGKVGQVLNLPETKIKRDEACLDNYKEYLNKNPNGTNFPYCPSLSETKQQRNIPAAILEGGMNPLTQALTSRNNQAINELITKSNIWYLPVGTEVEVFANQITRF
ncbi:MAG: hypothetical protein KME30_07090 [Iphinoe sp. HA4291-MV1]|jgi:hypothetical protein|nr:hypothetical protein [Iphinoe sp. HA4291-MV1]